MDVLKLQKPFRFTVQVYYRMNSLPSSNNKRTGGGKIQTKGILFRWTNLHKTRNSGYKRLVQIPYHLLLSVYFICLLMYLFICDLFNDSLKSSDYVA
jgi:hypothetical protein